MAKKFDSVAAWLKHLRDKHAKGKAYQTVNKVLPFVIFELFSLGVEAKPNIYVIVAYVVLDDHKAYRIGYDHTAHGIIVTRVVGKEVVALFVNGTTQEEVWKALNPVAAKAQKKQGAYEHEVKEVVVGGSPA